MKLARYIGNGKVEIVDEAMPTCPDGGLLVRTEASGLCSGELMAWYMDQKVPHVLGHEVAGIVIESQDARFPVGERVFPHHHAPCLNCSFCASGRYVHCPQWRRTKLSPGGMAEFFAVARENLTDTLRVGEMSARAAALIEPLACVTKSLRLSRVSLRDRVAVIGLGVMGLMHALAAPVRVVAKEGREDRRRWATDLGIDARETLSGEEFDVIFVCPGAQGAFDDAVAVAAPAARIVMFAPLTPGTSLRVPSEIYFRDIEMLHSYSCGPDDTQLAMELLRHGTIQPEQVVSHFIELNNLPEAYEDMKSGRILKPMVEFAVH